MKSGPFDQIKDPHLPLLNTLLETSQGTAQEIGKDLGPGGDWEPVVIIGARMVKNAKGDGIPGFPGIHIAVVCFAGELYSKPEYRHRLWVETLPMVLRQTQAAAFTFVSSAWMADPKATDYDPAKRVGEQKHKTEVLIVSGMTALSMRNTFAVITRDSLQVPTLGTFERDPDHGWQGVNMPDNHVRQALAGQG